VVELFDAETYQLVHRWETTADVATSWTADGSLLTVTNESSSVTGTTVFDVTTREVVLQYPGDSGITSPDGQRLVVGVFGSLDVIDVATGARTDILTGFDLLVISKAFSADGSRLIVGTAGQEVLVFDLESGKLAHRLGSAGIPLSYDCLASCETLLQSNLQGEVLSWDLSTTAGGELNSVNTGYFVNAESLVAGGETGAFLGFTERPHPDVVLFDRATGQITTDRRPTETNSPIPLPDGRVLLLEVSTTAPEWGPVVAWDPATGSVVEVAGCWTTQEKFEEGGFETTAPPPCADREGDYFYLDKSFLSPDETSLLITDPGGRVKIFDALTLAEESVPDMPAGHRTVLVYGGMWLISSDGRVANVVDLSDGRVVATLARGSADSWSGVTANGDLVVIYEWDKVLTVYDAASWKPITSFVPGPSRGLAFSPDGSKLMTAQSDGYVRIWDTRAGTELFRIPLPGASDGYWLDETHLVLGTTTGLWTTVTLDLEELKDLAVSRLTRGFTAEECETYRIDPCPNLETIKSR
jgi:WD40 repeat protein